MADRPPPPVVPLPRCAHRRRPRIAVYDRALNCSTAADRAALIAELLESGPISAEDAQTIRDVFGASWRRWTPPGFTAT